MSTLCRPGNWLLKVVLLMLMSVAVYACDGGPESEEESNPNPNMPQTENWDRFDVMNLGGDAASTPNVRAHVDSQGYVHLFYYKLGEQYNDRVRYQIHHAVWDSQTLALVGEEEMLEDVTPAYPTGGDSGLNNSLVLDAGVTTDGWPIVAYQGGKLAGTPGGELACNQTAQGDIMLNVFNGSNWNEYRGIYGDASDKNPLFTDGYVGTHGSFAVDSQNTIHMAAQFYYEMCDEHAKNNPDLMYVRQTMDQLGSYSIGWEQLVDDHNVYTGTYASNVTQMGYFCDLTLDLQDHPIIVYMGTPGQDETSDPVTSLRMAYDDDDDGQWTVEVIDELRNWQVQSLSAAVAPDGTIGVAYFMEEIDDTDFPNHLRYACRHPGGAWEVDKVDESSHCGDFPSLAFDAASLPVIAYYDIHANSGSYRQRKDLRFARYDGGSWKKETVASAGDIGTYNTIWVDADNLINICTYELSNQRIVIFREQAD